MFKKKCDDEEDWTPYRREQVCNAIHWHRNPNYSKICWREYAYNLIEEAEDEMLAGSFDGWIKTKQISNAQRWKTRSLEIWGSTISKKMEEDRRGDETRIRKLRTACFHDWCMVSYLSFAKLVFCSCIRTAPPKADTRKDLDPNQGILGVLQDQ